MSMCERERERESGERVMRVHPCECASDEVCDAVRDGTPHFYIVNGMSGPPGDHWHGVYREPGQRPLVYDSFGRGTRGFRGRGTERDAEQTKEGWDKDTCGPRCLAWGLVAQDFGQRADEI